MGFSIGNQNAGTINNVEGDQHVHGGQHGVAHVVTGPEAVAALRVAIDAVPVAAADPVTQEEVGHLEAAVRGAEPDREAAASALERLARRLRTIGAFASAGAALVEPVRRLALWLGPLAVGVVTQLH